MSYVTMAGGLSGSEAMNAPARARGAHLLVVAEHADAMADGGIRDLALQHPVVPEQLPVRRVDEVADHVAAGHELADPRQLEAVVDRQDHQFRRRRAPRTERRRCVRSPPRRPTPSAWAWGRGRCPRRARRTRRPPTIVELPAERSAPHPDAAVVLVELFDGAPRHQRVGAFKTHAQLAASQQTAGRVVPVAHVGRSGWRHGLRADLRVQPPRPVDRVPGEEDTSVMPIADARRRTEPPWSGSRRPPLRLSGSEKIPVSQQAL